MHGRKKVSIDEATKIKKQQKAKKIKLMVADAMESRENPEKEKAFIETGTPILDLLDDFATVWNVRKEYVLKNKTKEVIDNELKIAGRVLLSNPKSYWGWHHRRWCIDLLDDYDCHPELELSSQFILADCRNFHAWRHRRWAAHKCGNVDNEELQNMSKLIEANFSNFSAWHYRSQLLKPDSNFEDEIEFAKAAFWTDVNDQSSWIYFRWLLNQPVISQNQELIESEISTMEELIAEEPKSKYPLLGLIWLQKKLATPNSNRISEAVNSLCSLDPIRAPYYQELRIQE